MSEELSMLKAIGSAGEDPKWIGEIVQAWAGVSVKLSTSQKIILSVLMVKADIDSARRRAASERKARQRARKGASR